VIIKNYINKSAKNTRRLGNLMLPRS